MSKRLFIALSTRQNIANLLPILELAEPGDAVLWIESATSVRLGWGDGAVAVLAEAGGPEVLREVLADDEPASMFRLVSSHGAVRGFPRRCLILNGGTKPQMLAVQAALGPGPLELAYNLESTCALERFPGGAQAAGERAAYVRHRIDLPEILRCTGRALEAGAGERIWPQGVGEAAPAYGDDAAVTAATHRAWHAFEARSRVEEGVAWESGLDAIAARDPQVRTQVPYEEAARLLPERVAALKRSLGNGKEVGDPRAEGVYNGVLKLARLARSAWHSQGLARPPELGLDFEAAVRARVLRWLDATPDYAAVVQSVWRGVKVRRGFDAAGSAAEIDCALVLRNGVVLNLECKSYDATLKDLNSRLAELQRAASRPAEMAVCMPLYTGFQDQVWFSAMAERAEKVREWGYFQSLPFTLPGQPAEYRDALGRSVEVPPFETALAGWLRRYLPATVGTLGPRP